MEESTSVFKTLTGIYTEKTLLRRHMHRYEHNVECDLKEMGDCVMNRLASAQEGDYCTFNLLSTHDIYHVMRLR